MPANNRCLVWRTARRLDGLAATRSDLRGDAAKQRAAPEGNLAAANW
jgi:hypothetical protein